MRHNIRIVSTYPPRRCGIGTFARDLATALAHFTGEVGTIRVAAIDCEGLRYDLPVDIVINQHDPDSWTEGVQAIIARATEGEHPTAVLIQHEYGLHPSLPDGQEGGSYFVHLAQACGEAGLLRLVYLHTVLEDPDPYQRAILQELARHSDGLIVTTESAIETLEKLYGIDRGKVKHIDHGIRMEHPSQYDRLTIKESLGLSGFFLVTTIGMLSPDKGIHHGVAGYAQFVNKALTPNQRRRALYLIAGSFHPEFKKADGGEPYRQYRNLLEQTLQEAGLQSRCITSLDPASLAGNDVVFLESFLDETTLIQLYAATNAMLLPYLNMQQISSGILADTLGSGRVAIATKFRYAVELIHSNRRCTPGVVIGRHARGILVDAAQPEQIAQALDYLAFNANARMQMEREAHQRGYQMRWHNSAWALLQHLGFLEQQDHLPADKAARFRRERPPVLAIHRSRVPGCSEAGRPETQPWTDLDATDTAADRTHSGSRVEG